MQDNAENELIAKLYGEMYRLLYIYASNALESRALAEEAVQDTFRIACVKYESLLASENPQGWLLNALKYEIKNIRRAQARHNELLLDLLPSDADGEAPENGFELLDAFAGVLRKDELTLLRLVVFDEHTLSEAARALGISLEACKKRFQRAKKKLRAFLESENKEKEDKDEKLRRF